MNNTRFMEKLPDGVAVEWKALPGLCSAFWRAAHIQAIAKHAAFRHATLTGLIEEGDENA